MKSFCRKIINDTLKEKGRWSRTSLTTLVAFSFMLLIGTFIVMSDSVLNVEINRYAIDVFDTMVFLVGALTGFNITDKKIPNKINRHQEETDNAE